MPSALEVECKFLCNDELEAKISSRAISRNEKSFVDSYLDLPDTLILLRIDHWLRRRNGIFELKVPSVPLVDRIRLLEERKALPTSSSLETKPYVDSYIEIVEASLIASRLLTVLSLPESDYAPVTSNDELEQFVTKLGLTSFADIKTKRKHYNLSLSCAPKDVIGIDIDEVVYDDGSNYAVAEVEVMVESGEDSDGHAHFLIGQFFKEFNVARPEKPLVGKVLEFFKRKAPVHYAVVKEGLMKLKLAGRT
jgi:hypothetical protein